MRIKTSELEGTALDWAVAQATEDDDVEVNNGYATDRSGAKVDSKLVEHFIDYSERPFIWEEPYSPSTDWGKGGPLIESNSVWLSDDEFEEYPETRWAASIQGVDMQEAKTPLIAACRAIVAAKFGVAVDIPEELL